MNTEQNTEQTKQGRQTVESMSDRSAFRFMGWALVTLGFVLMMTVSLAFMSLLGVGVWLLVANWDDDQA